MRLIVDNNYDFNKTVERRLSEIKRILGVKAGEYASNGNRFHNFDKAAQRRNITPERALDGMNLKHEVSVDDLIELCDISPERLTLDLINEKIGDQINYLILLEGLLKRRMFSKYEQDMDNYSYE